MRPSSLPRLIVAQTPIAKSGGGADMCDSPYSTHSTHSRNSSTASDNYSPLARTFSFHEHNPHPSSSSSSVATTPPKYEPSIESSNRISRTTLDDLVEDPCEREDTFELRDSPFDAHTNTCPCGLDQDQPHDVYQLSEPEVDPRLCQSTSALARTSLDYSLADNPSDWSSDNESPLKVVKSRQGSTDSPVSALASRLGNRLPSFSKRRGRTLSSPNPHRLSIKSAPSSRVPSRTSSMRTPPSVAETLISPATPESETTPATARTSVVEPLEPVETLLPQSQEPIDRKALASTPLLPMHLEDDEQVQSPLQSPTVAGIAQFPVPVLSSPIMLEGSLPVLSPQASSTSLSAHATNQAAPPSSDVPSISMDAPQDEWTKRLGHNNFKIQPAPYLPEHCNVRDCKRLLEDWESARRQFLHQAARTSDNYGPTSQVYKFTEQKWAEIDAQWKKNHELVVARAAANGESPVYQPLAETTPLTQLPALNDPYNLGKFPKLDDHDIVGPMVQYAKITPKTSKKTAFLRFFNDLRSPSNTLGRSPASFGP